MCAVQRFDLEIINIMNNDGSLNAAAGAYEGLDRFDARKKLWADITVSPLLSYCLLPYHTRLLCSRRTFVEMACRTLCKSQGPRADASTSQKLYSRDVECFLLRLSLIRMVSLGLQEAGLAIREEPYTMRVPRSQRGGEVIEPLVREQWFVSMQPLAEPALKVRPSPTSSQSLYMERLVHHLECRSTGLCPCGRWRSPPSRWGRPPPHPPLSVDVQRLVSTRACWQSTPWIWGRPLHPPAPGRHAETGVHVGMQ